MSKFAVPTFAALALLGTVAVAQTPSDHGTHHPDTPAPAVKPPKPPMGMGGTMGGGMMGGDMGKTLSMMRMMDGAMGPGSDGMGMMPFDRIEGRIAFYKAELGITDAQIPQWTAYADAMREGAKTMKMAMTTAMGAGMSATAPDRADAMVTMMSGRVAAMKASATSFRALYAVLTDAQKKTADELPMPMMGIGRPLR
jgi:hypothetical protein